MNENNIEKVNDDCELTTNTIEKRVLKTNESKSLPLAGECEWDSASAALLSPMFQNGLDDSRATMKNKLLSLKNAEACAEIGFDWGSCAAGVEAR